MAIRAITFRKELDKAAKLTSGSQTIASYIFLGDLNTMGLNYTNPHDIAYDEELKRWDRRASQYYNTRRLTKSHNKTWSNGSGSSLPDSDLDHVYASKHLQFKSFTGPQGQTGEVDVRGWVNEPTPAKKDAWIQKYSDHSLLFLEVQKI
jgi:hypothetical protein